MTANSGLPRIALVTYSTRPRGGVVHTLHLAEALAAAGARVTVWSLARGGDDAFFRPVRPTVDVRVIPFKHRDGETVTDRIVRSIDTMRAAFEPHGYDIVHAQDCISANAVGPCIRTVHHLDDFTTPVLAQCHERAITEPYAHVCVSRAVADELDRDWGVRADVIGNGVEAGRFSAAADDNPRARAGRDGWRDRLGPFVLAVGGIEPRKGSIDLVTAWAALRRRRRGLGLVFAGGETLFDYRHYRIRFDRACETLGARPTVLGPVAHDELPALVAACDAFAFPSIKEGFGLAAMEALAARRPVVARDLPVLREVFGTSVSYFHDVAALADRLGDAVDGRGPESVSGHRLAASRTWEAAAQRHLRFYARHPYPGRAGP